MNRYPPFVSLAIVSVTCLILAGNLSAGTADQWDWNGVIGTGQSLSVGQMGKPVISTNQPYNNLKLTTGNLELPIDPDDTNIALVPLVEPIGRYSTNYPSAWPQNIAGETPHTAMADEITALVRASSGHDYITAHSCVGENGQGMIYLKKGAPHVGVNGHAYEASMIETRAFARLARAAGKTYGVSAIIVTHGETDAGNQQYEEQLYKLWTDYNSDIPAITGQSRKIVMIVSQQNACADHSPSAQAQWKIGEDHPDWIVCSGPKYQYPYAGDSLHLIADGYRQLGEKYAQIYYDRVILGQDWQPLAPTGIEHSGLAITIHFHVPVAPLVWDTNFDSPHQSVDEWKNGKGFEVSTAAGTKVAIQSAAISGDAVILTCATDPGANARVGYAMVAEPKKLKSQHTGSLRWGLLRDSDPFVGAVTQLAQPNFCVAFDMTTP
ncbi:MAG TPA: dockerin [Verrucomicrobiae bacterium]|jgi:hypothetical protein